PRHYLLGRNDADLLHRDLHLIDRRDGEADGDAAQRVDAGRWLEALMRTPEARQIVRAARLRAGAAQPFAAEGLAADHGADLVAVDIDIAGADRGRDVLDARIDAGMEAEGQPVAGGVDRRDDRVELAGLEGRDMQDG